MGCRRMLSSKNSSFEKLMLGCHAGRGAWVLVWGLCFRPQGGVRQWPKPRVESEIWELQEGPEESQVSVTETETRATCYNAFQKLCKTSPCLCVLGWLNVSVFEHICVHVTCASWTLLMCHHRFCLLVAFKAGSLIALEFIE